MYGRMRSIWRSCRYSRTLKARPSSPRKHTTYAFDLSDATLSDLMLATKHVAKLLDSKLEDVGRTAMVFEGYDVDHVHAKLFPMHGTADLQEWRKIESSVGKYFNGYEGYISSHDHERANDAALAELAIRIRE